MKLKTATLIASIGTFLMLLSEVYYTFIGASGIGTTLKLVGRIIMVVGILAGLLIGFAEIIILLNDIKYNTNKL